MFTFEHIVIAALTNINSPVICIVFQQPIKTAPRTDLSRVARFVKPCAVRNEDSRYEILVPRALVTLVQRNGKTKTSGKIRLSSAFHWPLTERAQFHRKFINNNFVPRFSICKPRAEDVQALGTIASNTKTWRTKQSLLNSTYKSSTRSQIL